MPEPIYIDVWTEDDLSKEVAIRLLSHSGFYQVQGPVRVTKGKAKLIETAKRLNHTAKSGYPYFMLTDLDAENCPSAFIDKCFPQGKHPNLLFRIAVQEGGLQPPAARFMMGGGIPIGSQNFGSPRPPHWPPIVPTNCPLGRPNRLG